MRTHRAVVLVGWLVVALAGAPSAVRAAVDVNGDWELAISPDAFVSPFTCVFTLTQTGTALSVAGPTGTCFSNPFGSLAASGSIDPVTGVFVATGSAGFACPGLTVSGTAASDTSLAATFSCTGIVPVTGAIVGDRCGNGVVDFGEACDALASPTCCDAACQPRAAGIDCLNDPSGQLCVDGECDGAGTCVIAPRTGACDDGNVCTGPDACAAGVCVGAPRPAGDRCDLDFDNCTSDACDGAGACVAGGCSPCCDATAGCTPAPSAGCVGPIVPKAQILVRKGKLRWKLRNGDATDVADFGDPTATTDYSLCVYGTSGAASYLLMAADAPAAGTCKGRPCWKSRPGVGFKYADRERTPDGLDVVTLAAGPAGRTKVVVGGKGPHLDTAFGIPVPPVRVQLKATGGACWESVHETGLFNNGTIVDKQGSPSGAFVGE